MTNRRIHCAITQAVLAVTLSLTLHSHSYAATLTQTGTPGTNGTNATTDAGNGTNATPGQDLTIPITSSDPANTLTITGGAGGNGGNGAPTTSAPKAGNAGAGANGGNATITATLSPASNSISNLTATGGNGGQAGTPGPAGTSSTAGNSSISGNGGNATITLAPLSTSPQLFTANITVQGGNGGDAQGAGAHSGNGGTASISNLPLFPANTDVNLTLNQIGGNAGIASNGATIGNGAASNLTITSSNPFANSTGNITLTQNAVGGNGTGGNAISNLSVNNFEGQSFNAAVSAIAGAGPNTSNAIVGIGGINPTVSAYAAGSFATASATAVTPVNSTGKAFATSVTTINNGNATAHALSGSSIFPQASINATGSAAGNQTVAVLMNSGPISLANGTPQSAVSLVFAPTTPNTSGPINNPLINLQFLDSNSSAPGSQSHTASFNGALDPTQLTPGDVELSLSTLSLPSNFTSLTFTFSTDTLFINQSFTNYADAAAYFNQTIDLGELSTDQSFRVFITASLTLTTDTPGENFELAANLSNSVPEPASLSLLAAALPLLLKRRR